MAKYKVKAKDNQLELKVKLSSKEELNERQLDFFSGKYVRGLFKIQARKKNCIEYYGPIGISLVERLKRPISKYDFLFMMEQIVDTTQKLNANSLIINTEPYGVHYSTPKSMYKGGYSTGKTQQQMSTDFGGVNSSGVSNLVIISGTSSGEYKEESIQTPIDSGKEKKGKLFSKKSTPKTIKEKEKKKGKKEKNKGSDPFAFLSIPTVENGGYAPASAEYAPSMETTVLKKQDVDMPQVQVKQSVPARMETGWEIVRTSTGTVYPLYYGQNRIGRKAEIVDICILGNVHISRFHANIICTEAGLFLEDNNSKNGTFLYQSKNRIFGRVVINRGDVFYIGDEEFRVH